MAKKFFQILDFFKMTHFDYDEIRQVYDWLKKNDLDLDPYELSQRYIPATFDEFKNWLHSGYGVGDIIKYKGHCEVVGPYVKDNVLLQTMHSDDGLGICQLYGDYYYYTDEYFAVEKNEISMPSKDEENVLKKELHDKRCYIDMSGFIFSWPVYVENGAFIKVKVFGDKYLGKIMSVNYDTVNVSYILVDGALQTTDQKFHDDEFSKAKPKEIKEARQYCIEHLGYDIKTDEYIDDVQVKDFMIKANLPTLVADYIIKELNTKPFPVKVKDIIEELTRKYELKKPRIETAVYNFLDSQVDILEYELDNSNWLIAKNKICYDTNDFKSLFSELCRITDQKFLEFYWLEKYISKYFADDESNLWNSFDKQKDLNFSYYIIDDGSYYLENRKFLGLKNLMNDTVFLSPCTNDDYIEFLKHYQKRNFIFERNLYNNTYILDEVKDWYVKAIYKDISLSSEHYQYLLELTDSVLDAKKLTKEQKENLKMADKYVKFYIKIKHKPRPKVSSEKEMAKWYNNLIPDNEGNWMFIVICRSKIKMAIHEAFHVE